jgi:hypothetical protein
MLGTEALSRVTTTKASPVVRDKAAREIGGLFLARDFGPPAGVFVSQNRLLLPQ